MAQPASAEPKVPPPPTALTAPTLPPRANSNPTVPAAPALLPRVNSARLVAHTQAAPGPPIRTPLNKRTAYAASVDTLSYPEIHVTRAAPAAARVSFGGAPLAAQAKTSGYAFVATAGAFAKRQSPDVAESAGSPVPLKKRHVDPRPPVGARPVKANFPPIAAPIGVPVFTSGPASAAVPPPAPLNIGAPLTSAVVTDADVLDVVQALNIGLEARRRLGEYASFLTTKCDYKETEQHGRFLLRPHPGYTVQSLETDLASPRPWLVIPEAQRNEVLADYAARLLNNLNRSIESVAQALARPIRLWQERDKEVLAAACPLYLTGNNSETGAHERAGGASSAQPSAPSLDADSPDTDNEEPVLVIAP